MTGGAEHVGEVDQDLTPSEVDEKLWRVQTSIAAANKESADAVARAAGLIDTRHPEMDLRNAHGALTDAYHELTRAIDVVEKTMDDLGPLLFQLVESLRTHPMAFEPLPTREEAEGDA